MQFDKSIEPRKNRLLASLPPEDWERLAPQLELVEMHSGMVLYDHGAAMSHIYFPIDAVVALFYESEDGTQAGIAIVGNDGLVGVSLFMGGRSTPGSAVVQCAGRGYRLSSQRMLCEFDRGGPSMQVLLRYTQALLTQMSQTAVCNRRHTVDQQLCRCLLLMLDGLAGEEIEMTHEGLAQMLGVRREGVTASARKLRDAGHLRHSRGRLTVLDRKALEHCACECYSVVRDEYHRLLPFSLPTVISQAPAAGVQRPPRQPLAA